MEFRAGTVTITDSDFIECSTTCSGGALSLYTSGSSYTITATVSNSRFIRCSAINGSGGAISVGRSTGTAPALALSKVVMQDCTGASGQVIHLYNCNSFTWEHLCITGTGNFVSAELESISLPSEEELTEGCEFTHFSLPYTHNGYGHMKCLAKLVFSHYLYVDLW